MKIAGRPLRRLPESSELLTFVVVAESESLSQAGRRLHVSAQAVAKRLRNLESILGTELFTRGPRGTTLTRSGHALYRRAARIVDEAEALLPGGDARSDGWSGIDRLVGRPSAAIVGDLEAILDSVLAAVSDGVALVRASDGMLVAVNQALCEIVGWSRDDLLAGTVFRSDESRLGIRSTATGAVCVLAVTESEVELGDERLRLICVARDATVREVA